jgi:hypothetical protein
MHRTSPPFETTTQSLQQPAPNEPFKELGQPYRPTYNILYHTFNLFAIPIDLEFVAGNPSYRKATAVFAPRPIPQSPASPLSSCLLQQTGA